jgi:hypothetical protein
MKWIPGICLIFWLGALIGCRPAPPTISLGGYNFKYEGIHYRIESVSPSFRDGYNLLIRKEGNQLLLKAVDWNQDGILDEIEIGTLSMGEAGRIYQSGLQEGAKKGFIKQKDFTREYRTRVDVNTYLLATYLPSVGDPYNKFIVKDLSRREAVTVDEGADGRIDRVLQGEQDVSYYQTHYRMVLIRALEEKRVVQKEGRYLVAWDAP